MLVPGEIYKKVLALKPVQKAELIDKLILSLDHPDQKNDLLWGAEIESRIDAYDRGCLQSVPLQQVLDKYNRQTVMPIRFLSVAQLEFDDAIVYYNYQIYKILNGE